MENSMLNRIYLLVKLRHSNSIIRAAIVVIPLKRNNPVIIVVKVNKSIINATYGSIWVRQRATILKATAPINPGTNQIKKKRINSITSLLYYIVPYLSYVVWTPFVTAFCRNGGLLPCTKNRISMENMIAADYY